MMEKLTPQERDAIKAGVILVVLLIAGAIYYSQSLVKPEIADDKKAIEKIDKEIADIDAQLHQMDLAAANREQLKEKQELLARVAAKLPKTIDPQNFYQAFQRVLTLTRVEYSELSQEGQASRGVYTEIPYLIVCRGRYHDFGQFLNMIEENPDRLMRIKTFQVENDPGRPSVHPLQVRIATFMFNQKG